MSDVQMFWSLCAECVEFLSQGWSEAVLIESKHEGQTDKQRLYPRKWSDRVLTAYTYNFCARADLYIKKILKSADGK